MESDSRNRVRLHPQNVPNPSPSPSSDQSTHTLGSALSEEVVVGDSVGSEDSENSSEAGCVKS